MAFPGEKAWRNDPKAQMKGKRPKPKPRVDDDKESASRSRSSGKIHRRIPRTDDAA